MIKYFQISAIQIISTLFVLSAFFVPNTHAECKADLKGTASLTCLVNKKAKTLALKLKDGRTRRVTPKKAKKLIKKDKGILKNTRKEINKLKTSLENAASINQIGITLVEAEILTKIDNTLVDFGNQSVLAQQQELQQMDVQQAQVTVLQIEHNAKKTQSDIRRIERDVNTAIRKMREDSSISTSKFRRKICKKKRRLQDLICTSEIFCRDGTDNDSDGTIDCDDSDCSNDRACNTCQAGEHVASLVFESGDFGYCACYNRGFVKWDKKLSRGATSVTAILYWSGGNPGDFETTRFAPYDNAYSLNGGEVVLSPPSGSNWIMMTQNGGSDGNLDRCSPKCGPLLAFLKKRNSNPRVRINCPRKRVSFSK